MCTRPDRQKHGGAYTGSCVCIRPGGSWPVAASSSPIHWSNTPASPVSRLSSSLLLRYVGAIFFMCFSVCISASPKSTCSLHIRSLCHPLLDPLLRAAFSVRNEACFQSSGSTHRHTYAYTDTDTVRIGSVTCLAPCLTNAGDACCCCTLSEIRVRVKPASHVIKSSSHQLISRHQCLVCQPSARTSYGPGLKEDRCP